MLSTLKNSLNQETIMPSIKPEVMEFFQNRINPNMTPEQVEEVINSLNTINSQPNPIFGQIVNLLYLENGTNLVSIIMQDNSSGNIYAFSSDPNIDVEAELINVANLNDFRFRLQEAFNYNLFVSIKYENDRIISLVITNQVQALTEVQDSIASDSRWRGGPVCCFPRLCPPKF